LKNPSEMKMKNLLTFMTDVIETPIADLKEREELSGQHRYVVRQTIRVDESMSHKDIERLLLSNIFSRSYRKIDDISHLSLCAIYEDESDLEHKVMKEIFSKTNGKYIIKNLSRLDRITFNLFNGDRKRFKYFTKRVEDVSDVPKLLSLRNESQNDDGTFTKSLSNCFDEIQFSFNDLVA